MISFPFCMQTKISSPNVEMELTSPPKPTRMIPTMMTRSAALLYTPPLSFNTATPPPEMVRLNPVPIRHLPGSSRTPQMLGSSAISQPELAGPCRTSQIPETSIVQQSEGSLRRKQPIPGQQRDELRSPCSGENANLSLENRLVERALENVLSLPETCPQVDDTSYELKRQQDGLAQAEDKFRYAKDNCQKLNDEAASLQRKIYLGEEKVAVMGMSCKQKQTDISDMLMKNRRLAELVRDKEDEFEQQNTLIEAYKEKMTAHSQAVFEVETASDIYLDLIEKRNNIESLQTEKMSMEADLEKLQKTLSGEFEREIQLEIEKHELTLKTLSEDKEKLQKKLNEEAEEQAKIIQSTEVLRKRNSAQLTRLQKRLNDVQKQNRHGKQQASKLQESIDHLKSELSL